MNHDAGAFKSIADEVDGLMEVSSEIESFTVFPRDLQVKGNVCFRVAEIYSFCGC